MSHTPHHPLLFQHLSLSCASPQYLVPRLTRGQWSRRHTHCRGGRPTKCARCRHDMMMSRWDRGSTKRSIADPTLHLGFPSFSSIVLDACMVNVMQWFSNWIHLCVKQCSYLLYWLSTQINNCLLQVWSFEKFNPLVSLVSFNSWR